jgi:hypothetical protein
MSWAAAASAVASGLYAAEARQTIPSQHPLENCYLTSDGENYSWRPHAARNATSAKCPCCGSRQFKDHHSVRICSYCRSEQ